jgi:hypothetical protein
MLGCLTSPSTNRTGCYGDEPIKYLSSCRADFNGDRRVDIGLLIESDYGREALILLRGNAGYSVYSLSDSLSETMYMCCGIGNMVSGTTEEGDEVDRQTPGAYLVLYQPESASQAWYWTGTEFEYIWLGD